MAPPDHVLIACDYNQLELVCLSQHCYTTFGHSRMMTLINMGVDLHRWLGARILGVLTESNDIAEGATAEQAKELNEWLKTVVDTPTRALAKICSFGFPGGMSAKTFVGHCRNNGVTITPEESENLRAVWLKAFPEMQEHLDSPQGVVEVDDQNNAGATDRKVYENTALGGFKRVRCSKPAACNLVFQSLAATGGKVALWNLYKAGARLINWVHDEAIIELPEEQLPMAAVYQTIMEESMREVCPDVTVRTEATAMRRWDKAAHSEVDEDGNLSIYEEEDAE